MSASSEGSTSPALRLARRLRDLRQSGLGQRLTQEHLGQLLGGRQPLSAPLISSWERERSPVTPPEDRIRAYARLFATDRSVAKGLLNVGELTEAEKARFATLEDELLGLREEVIGAIPAALGSMIEEPPVARAVGYGTWHFEDQRPVVIVSSELPARERPEYADPSSPDYVEMYRYADLDAMVDLYGHLRAANPQNNRIRFRPASQLTRDDYASHLILLGGVDWNPVTRGLLDRLDLPVRQVSAEDRAEDAYFEVVGGRPDQRFRPIVVRHDDKVELQEDVALFYRGLSPFNRRRTVTICNAMYGRGTLGAVRALTDAWFRDRNEEYLRGAFGDAEEFGLLLRVPVFAGNTVTPDWSLPENRLFEWSSEGESSR